MDFKSVPTPPGWRGLKKHPDPILGGGGWPPGSFYSVGGYDSLSTIYFISLVSAPEREDCLAKGAIWEVVKHQGSFSPKLMLSGMTQKNGNSPFSKHRVLSTSFINNSLTSLMPVPGGGIAPPAVPADSVSIFFKKNKTKTCVVSGLILILSNDSHWEEACEEPPGFCG